MVDPPIKISVRLVINEPEVYLSIAEVQARNY